MLPVRVSCICIILGNFTEKNYPSFRKWTSFHLSAPLYNQEYTTIQYTILLTNHDLKNSMQPSQHKLMLHYNVYNVGLWMKRAVQSNQKYHMLGRKTHRHLLEVNPHRLHAPKCTLQAYTLSHVPWLNFLTDWTVPRIRHFSFPLIPPISPFLLWKHPLCKLFFSFLQTEKFFWHSCALVIDTFFVAWQWPFPLLWAY